MKLGPRYKICKRFGSSVFEKCQTQKFTLSEQRRGKQRRQGGRPRALSDYGRQLAEKQRARFTYGVSERQFARYARTAAEQKDLEPSLALLLMLELRLDNVTFRMGLAPTRRAARQMVSHGHITVNGRKVTVPSYSVQEGDVIAIREGSRVKTLFSDLPERYKEIALPSWVSFDPAKHTGTIQSRPTQELVEPQFDPTVVLEFYSR